MSGWTKDWECLLRKGGGGPPSPRSGSGLGREERRREEEEEEEEDDDDAIVFIPFETRGLSGSSNDERCFLPMDLPLDDKIRAAILPAAVASL
jgi:hypothetical protein